MQQVLGTGDSPMPRAPFLIPAKAIFYEQAAHTPVYNRADDATETAQGNNSKSTPYSITVGTDWLGGIGVQHDDEGTRGDTEHQILAINGLKCPPKHCC